MWIVCDTRRIPVDITLPVLDLASNFSMPGRRRAFRASDRFAFKIVGQAKEFVGLLAHGGHDEHNIVAPLLAASDMVSDFTDSVWSADGRTAELLHIERHGRSG